jgi:anionic cell wall polymer biosynthesis LytR-Cps2A-Psr (LCP) family protein
MAGVSDLTRNERQRAFLISMMGRVSDLGNPTDVLSIARAVAPYVTVDDDLSLMDAVGLASTMKGLDTGDVVELEIPVADYVADDGAMVLIATADVARLVADFIGSDMIVSSVGESG